ncbi:MAG: YkgJ family cysteine cluster protein [Azospirillaceae bacterium]
MTDNGLSFHGRYRDVAAEAYRLTARFVDRAVREGSVAPLRDGLSALGGLLAAARASEAPEGRDAADGSRNACAAGCGYCCTLFVEITPLEALVLADHIRARMCPEDAWSAEAGILRICRDGRPESVDWRIANRLPCPLRLDDLCSVYEDRPLVCRAYASRSWLACLREASFPFKEMPVPVDAAAQDVSGAIYNGLVFAVRDAGLETGVVELIRGVGLTLATPEAHRRWLSGEAVFAPAREGGGRPPGSAAARGQMRPATRRSAPVTPMAPPTA